MEKVFSKEKFREAMKKKNYFTPEQLDDICTDPDYWVKKCEGLTEEEMNKIGFATLDEWMVEVEK